MHYDTGAFFTENEETDVQGFAVIETDSTEGYRIAEKWVRPDKDGGPIWITYWLPESQLLARVDARLCDYTKDLTEKQLRGVRNLAGVRQELVA